ncbi:MAG TPA: hypothetical protein VGR63_17525 [Casimicrobiaceae bacterium]|jgi:ribosomal protein S8E|nr:hypothetical protein [Casimicrobiaceae bacterium]
MLTTSKVLVVLGATTMLPITAAASTGHVRMQDFVTVQSQQSTPNYADRYTVKHGAVVAFQLAPVAASVAPVAQGGVLHVASNTSASRQARAPTSGQSLSGPR